MPHIIFNGQFSLKDFYSSFEPIVEEDQFWLIKINEIYLEKYEKRAIVPVVVVEEGHSQSFYVIISFNPSAEKLSVRLDPETDPIKTRGVKRAIALIGETIITGRQNLKIDHSNVAVHDI